MQDDHLKDKKLYEMTRLVPRFQNLIHYRITLPEPRYTWMMKT